MPHPVDIHVGKRLRLRRTILGLSQETIGKAIGVTFQQIQKYERGVNRMGASRLFDFSKILNVPVSYFFEELDGNVDYKVEASPLQVAAEANTDFEHKQLMSRETLEMVRAYYKIKEPQVRKRVSALIKTFSEGASE